MDIIFYILIVIGSIMVYGTSIILKRFKLDNNIKAIISLKFVGLGIALIGILKILKVY